MSIGLYCDRARVIGAIGSQCGKVYVTTLVSMYHQMSPFSPLLTFVIGLLGDQS